MILKLHDPNSALNWTDLYRILSLWRKISGFLPYLFIRNKSYIIIEIPSVCACIASRPGCGGAIV